MPRARIQTNNRNGHPPAGMSHVSPRRRPSVSPREYAARLDLLHVRDCQRARMGVSEIARHLKKDKAWVSRAIHRLQSESATIMESPEERELVEENISQLNALLAKTLAIVETTVDTGKKLTAIRAAGEMLRQKADYEIAIGRVQKRGNHSDPTLHEDAEKWREVADSITPEAVDAIYAAMGESERL